MEEPGYEAQPEWPGMSLEFYHLSFSSRELYVTSVKRGCVMAASVSPHTLARVPSLMPPASSVTEESGTMVTTFGLKTINWIQTCFNSYQFMMTLK